MPNFGDRLADAPLYLSWKRQGKVWWNEDWLEAYGPVRQRIPGLDDHISFANYDLRQNRLPQISTTSEGRPFIMCISPLGSAELGQVHSDAVRHFDHPWQVDDFMKTQVYQRLGTVTQVLDVVFYHGFEPAIRTAGLDCLDQLAPRKGLQRVEYRDRDRRLDP